MPEEIENEILDKLKSRGLDCKKLRSLEKREMREAGQFRQFGFNDVASAQEESANKIRALKNKVCRLK